MKPWETEAEAPGFFEVAVSELLAAETRIEKTGEVEAEIGEKDEAEALDVVRRPANA